MAITYCVMGGQVALAAAFVKILKCMTHTKKCEQVIRIKQLVKKFNNSLFYPKGMRLTLLMV